MSDPFLGEIKINAFNYPPQYWAYCNGQLLNISQNSALFSLLGTTFGGDGKTTFALPNLQGRTAVHPDPRVNFKQGTAGGAESVTLTTASISSHTHGLQAMNVAATDPSPVGKMLSQTPSSGAIHMYHAAGDAMTAMDSRALLPAGGSQPHANMQPYLALNFCIALVGIYPMRP
jgi:microcystin-dependent protein